MSTEKPPLLSHLNPLRDMEHARARGPEGTIFVAYRNLVRGAVYGALSGAILDNTIGNGGVELAILFGACGAVTDMIQGLGRGAVQLTQGNNSR